MTRLVKAVGEYWEAGSDDERNLTKSNSEKVERSEDLESDLDFCYRYISGNFGTKE